MSPYRPNRMMADNASANGGLTMGSSAITWMKRFSGRGSGTRTCTYAKRKPMSEPTVATTAPRTTVLIRI